MLEIDGKLLSLDIIQKKFVCDIQKCKGACCVHGDSGAPLEKIEAKNIDEHIKKIIPFMRREGIKAIEKNGNHYIDQDGDLVTMLRDGKECAYVYFDEGIARCAIETAYQEGKIYFAKPLSCHLYPIRRKKYSSFEGLNYDQWDICKDAVKKGENENVPVYVFAKESLTRTYGEDFYQQLKYAAENLKIEK